MLSSTHRPFNAIVHTTVVATILGGGTDIDAERRAERRTAPLGEIIVFNDNGAWSWFEDERAVVDPASATVLVSSVASAAGTDGSTRQGNVEVVSHHFPTGSSERSVLHPNLQADDHNSAALHILPDGRYLAMYSTHATDTLSRWRTTRTVGPGSQWERERHIDHDAPATYSNVYATDNRLYAFVRSAGRDPHILLSTDAGASWERAGRLLDGPGRPYVKYAADAAGRIHMLTTEQHPRDFANRVYHGIIDGRRLLHSDGTVVDADLFDGDAVPPQRLTPLPAPHASDRAWTVDLHVGNDGNPYAAFSVHDPPSSPGASHTNRYYYARFDGIAWRTHFLAHAGSALSSDEPFYTGLVALHPHDPWRVFVSTDVHPSTGAPLVSDADGLQHHELFEGITTDGGATWNWTPITANSTIDNIRPIVPEWDPNHTALLWLRGTYDTYQQYDLDVVGLITRPPAATTIRCQADPRGANGTSLHDSERPAFTPHHEHEAVRDAQRRAT